MTALQEKILAEKKARGICILAHSYMDPDVQEIADVVADSFKLSLEAKGIKEQTVLMCGVRFMAETVKMLSPDKKVLLSHSDATCPMAEQITPEQIVKFKEENPDFCVVAYINTTAKLKAVCDVCVTSSSALKIVKALPHKNILFIPDKNLGSFIKEQVPEKNIVLMDGYCPVHYTINPEDVIKAKAEHPDALVAVHPECRPDVVALCDFAGSTADIIKFTKSTDKPVIIATERGVYDKLSREFKDRKLYQLCEDKLVCKDMKYTTLEDVYNALIGDCACEITMDEALLKSAVRPIDAMLHFGG